MIFRPHMATVRILTDTVSSDTLVVKGATYGAAATVLGQLSPMSLTQAFDATGIAMKQPHLWMMDVADKDSMPIGAMVVVDGASYTATSPTAVYSMGLPADHASCVLEKLQYAD